jgi:YbgC/YbaW family acyl-CoA thioester hydrolase
MHRFDARDLRGREQRHFHHSLTVRFQDVDAAGIVFFARVLEYVHDGYVALLSELGSDLVDVLRQRRWAAPIRHAEADYFSPLRFGDAVVVAAVAARVEETELTLGWQLVVRERVAAVAQTQHVFVDPENFQRIPVPESFAPLQRWE